MKQALEKYGITDMGPDDMYRMIDNPKKKQKDAVIRDIKFRLLQQPNENFLIVFILAGHGMHADGK